MENRELELCVCSSTLVWCFPLHSQMSFKRVQWPQTGRSSLHLTLRSRHVKQGQQWSSSRCHEAVPPGAPFVDLLGPFWAAWEDCALSACDVMLQRALSTELRPTVTSGLGQSARSGADSLHAATWPDARSSV